MFVALLAACAGGPAYQRPDVTLPTQWHHAGDAVPASAPVSEAWWTDFESTELNCLIEAALEGNRDLKAAASRIAEARAAAQIAGANLSPFADVNAGVSRERGADAQTSTRHSAAFGASYELDLWGKNGQAHEAAIARLQSSAYARQSVKLALQAEVAVIYFQVLSSNDRLAVALNTLSNTQSVLRLLQVQHEAGAVSGLEVARQQGLVASVKASIPPLEQQREQALDALAILMGRPPQELPISTTPLDSIRLPQTAAGLPATLLEQRPDIRQAEADLVAASADINAARAAFFPSIKLTAAGGVESASLASLLRSANLVYTLAAGLTAPIFDGGRLRGQLEFAKARQDELVQVYQQSILSALRDVEDSLIAVRRLAEEAAHQNEVVAHALTASRMAELRYRNGAVDFTTVLDAQRVLLAAQAAQEAIVLSRYAAAVGLYRALGGGWEPSPQRSMSRR